LEIVRGKPQPKNDRLHVSANWPYHHHDALGSLRQLTDADGTVTLTKSYLPYGGELSNSEVGTSSYGFTGEMQDMATGLVYLRARYYSPQQQARFITEDIWDGNYTKPLSLNGWIYVEGNPINYVDSSGFARNLSVPIQFINCFDFSIGKGFDSPWISAQEAVDSCRAAYSKNAWSGWENRFGLNDGNKELPTTAVELFGWFVFEHGDNNHLWFDVTEPLTKELAHSLLTHNVRYKYYQTGDITKRVWFKYIIRPKIRQKRWETQSGLSPRMVFENSE